MTGHKIVTVRLDTRYTILVRFFDNKKKDENLILTTQPVDGRCYISEDSLLDSFKTWNNVCLKSNGND